MKRIFLITFLALLTGSNLVFAELTTDDVASPAYLKNHGHSDAIIWAVEKSIANVSGEPLEEPVNEKYQQPVIKKIRQFFMYIDPALDDHKFMNHDINPSTRYSDL